jgi:Staphylococcal nuclease homologue
LDPTRSRAPKIQPPILQWHLIGFVGALGPFPFCVVAQQSGGVIPNPLGDGREWECDLTGSDRYGRALGKCFVEGEDISSWMVRSGWALSFVRYSHDYDHEEAAARDAKAGLWAGAFIAPWDWRHRNSSTVVLGALSVPVDAQKTLLGAVSEAEAPDPRCTIRASIGRECIYHLPGDRWYAKMKIDSGKRWFCSVAEAEAAGCRAPKN